MNGNPGVDRGWEDIFTLLDREHPITLLEAHLSRRTVSHSWRIVLLFPQSYTGQTESGFHDYLVN